jgi:hypothetical protein
MSAAKARRSNVSGSAEPLQPRTGGAEGCSWGSQGGVGRSVAGSASWPSPSAIAAHPSSAGLIGQRQHPLLMSTTGVVVASGLMRNGSLDRSDDDGMKP